MYQIRNTLLAPNGVTITPAISMAGNHFSEQRCEKNETSWDDGYFRSNLCCFGNCQR
jgi:hypothetical protein